MTGRKFRRKVRKRKGAVGNSRMKFGLFFGIIALTVGLGFLTARFAIGPLIGFHAEKSPIQELAERKETAEQQKQTAAAEEEASAKTTADEQTDKGSAGSTAEKRRRKARKTADPRRQVMLCNLARFRRKLPRRVCLTRCMKKELTRKSSNSMAFLRF